MHHAGYGAILPEHDSLAAGTFNIKNLIIV